MGGRKRNKIVGGGKWEVWGVREGGRKEGGGKERKVNLKGTVLHSHSIHNTRSLQAV